MELIAELVIKARSGDVYAQEQLYIQTKDKAYYLALQLLKNNQDAEDVLQDAYIKSFSKIDDAIPERFQGWLDTIVINRAKDILKKKKPMAFAELRSDEGKDFEPSDEEQRIEFLPQDNLDYKETKRLIQEIIDGLPVEQRTAVILYYYKEMSVGQIAEYFECSAGTIKSRLNYARKTIKAKVEELEKKGTKLYCFPLLPFLYWMFKTEAKKSVCNSSNILQGIQHGIKIITNTNASEKERNISDEYHDVSTENQSPLDSKRELLEETSYESEEYSEGLDKYNNLEHVIETVSSTSNITEGKVPIVEGKNIAESMLHNAKIISAISAKLMKSGFVNSKKIIERGAISELIKLIVFSVVLFGGTIIGTIIAVVDRDITALSMGVVIAGLMFLVMICYKISRMSFGVLGATIMTAIVVDIVAIIIFSFEWIGGLIFAAMGIGYCLYLIYRLKKIL